MQLRPVALESAEVQLMLAEVQQFYVQRYGGEDKAPTSPTDFIAPTGIFWLAVLADQDDADHDQMVGCVGLRRHDRQTAELKRMFVRPAYRRQGLGRQMLLAAERHALTLGYRRLILETGHQQPEALSLYLAHGYTETANYGYRRNSTSAKSFVKTLRPSDDAGP